MLGVPQTHRDLGLVGAEGPLLVGCDCVLPSVYFRCMQATDALGVPGVGVCTFLVGLSAPAAQCVVGA